MDQRVQEAISAARTGNEREAQRLLSAVLKDDPEQVQAWFLLSHLVESDQKRQAYLGKVLALDPGHEQARQRLALLRSGETGGAIPEAKTQPAVHVADVELDVVRQAEGDTLPEWMAEDANLVQMETAVATPPPTTEESASDLPDWLQESVSSEFLGDEEVEELVPATASAPKPMMAVKQPPVKPTPASGSKASVQRWNLLLITFIILAIIVIILLINALRAL
ncbi:MAG: hypothetical protein H6662_20235 [Ardenticatenaceae bacterium]|nr:hypothetical protein [Anaerolineales bacterium]MCB8923915.1 hypothetical protein [Ardenticatenaceae bacterium]MCB9004378.1 hypothetical protein [Ardenticatenaceae bacterium]